MRITTIGIDLAKNIFQIHAETSDGKVVFNRALRRSQVLAFFEKLEPCLVGMEACATGHHWAREISKLGHEVRLMPPTYVKPYVKRGKSDAGDAAAICEAVTRPAMRFVAIKTVEQQALLSQHRARQVLVGPITASAVVATIGEPERFKSGRDFAAWIGLTPLNKSSGGKERLGRITKMGDKYLRRLLVAGMTARIGFARRRPDRVDPWIVNMLGRKPSRLATIAMANKTARIIWAVLVRNEPYRAPQGRVA